jgi:putative ABC transport system permease protein
VRYTVKGVLESKGSGGGFGSDIDNRGLIPLTTSFRQFNATRPMMMVIQSTGQETVEQAAADAKRILLRRLKEDDFTVMQQTELLNTINQFLGAITVALGGIAAISLLVGGIGIMNIMLVSVTERTREIGLRKAVGARPQDVLLQFLIESMILSLFGGLIGIGLGMLGSLAISQFIQTYVTAWSVFLASGFSAMIGIIFGVAPAVRASKLDPIEALRYE